MKESYTPDYVDHVENFGFVCVDYKKKIGVEMQRTGMQEVGKKTFLGDSVIGRTRVRTKRLNEKLIEIQKKTG